MLTTFYQSEVREPLVRDKATEQGGLTDSRSAAHPMTTMFDQDGLYCGPEAHDSETPTGVSAAAASYTAGPWEHCDGYVWSALNEHVADVRGYGKGLPIDANGALISAAPELYEALRAIVECWDGPKYSHTMLPNIVRARAILARARREAV